LVDVCGHVDGAATVRRPAAVGAVLLLDQNSLFCLVCSTDQSQRFRVRVRPRRSPLFQQRALTSGTNRTSPIFSIFCEFSGVINALAIRII